MLSPPKKHSSEWQTIYHLSYPQGNSISEHLLGSPFQGLKDNDSRLLSNLLLGPDRDVLPASKGTLVYFSSYLAKTVHHSTIIIIIKLYLAAVCNLHITAGYKGKLHLRKVLCDILHYQGQKCICHQPVTPQVVFVIHPVLQSWFSPWDFSMVRAAFNLAFLAFLHCTNSLTRGYASIGPFFILLLIA